jgi:hypothetical protein
MMNYKSMATPMITNQKKLGDSNAILVDPTMYRKLIGLFTYLVNTKPYILFVFNTLSQFMVELR